MVRRAKIAARVRSAPRHPCAPTSQADKGRKIVLASPPAKVTNSNARARPRSNHFAKTAKAGSYRVAAIARPMPTHTR
jgi:hypothetical protein